MAVNKARIAVIVIIAMALALFYPGGLPVLPPPPNGNGNGQSQLNIWIVADTHYFGEDSFQKRDMMRQYTGDWMRSFVTKAVNDKADAIFQLGDIVDAAIDWGVPAPGDLHRLHMQEAVNILEESHLPLYHVLGNHEIDCEGTTKSVAMQILGMQKSYYSFDLGDFHFIVLDDFDTDYLYEKNQQDFFRIYDAEKLWLQQDLELNKNKPTIVLTHVSVSGNFENIEKYHYRMYNSLRNGPTIRQILRSYPNVIAVLEGHYHNLTYYNVSLYTTYLWQDDHVRYIGIPSMTNQYSQNAYGKLRLSLEDEVAHFRLETTSAIGRLIQFDFPLTIAE